MDGDRETPGLIHVDKPELKQMRLTAPPQGVDDVQLEQLEQAFHDVRETEDHVESAEVLHDPETDVVTVALGVVSTYATVFNNRPRYSAIMTDHGIKPVFDLHDMFVSH